MARRTVRRVVLALGIVLGAQLLPGMGGVAGAQTTCPAGTVRVAVDLDPLTTLCLVIGPEVQNSQLATCPQGQILTVQGAVIVGGVLTEGALLCVAVGTNISATGELRPGGIDPPGPRLPGGGSAALGLLPLAAIAVGGLAATRAARRRTA